MLFAECLVCSLFVVGDNAANDTRFDFEKETVGELPRGWSAGKTGQGPGSVWTIVADDDAPRGAKTLEQTSSDGPLPLYNLCVADATSFGDLELSVKLKAVKGAKDQGGGPLWRYRDANNYYICRVNPIEGNFRVYKVVAGKRTQLGTADSSAAANRWHTIRVVHKGNRIECFLNDEKLLDVTDATFTSPGKVGVWTKADAVTRFDDLRITAITMDR